MTCILDFPPEIMRLILEELYSQGYQFNSVINVCQKWRFMVLHTIFRGPTQRWVYSQNHGCLVAYRGSEETSRLRERPGCLVRYGGVPLRLLYDDRKDCRGQKGGTGFRSGWGFWRIGDVKVERPGLVSPIACPVSRNQGHGVRPYVEV